MTLRTAAGRRTRNVRGQLATNASKRQITSDCGKTDTGDGSAEIRHLRKCNSVNLAVQLFKIKAGIFRCWTHCRVRLL